MWKKEKERGVSVQRVDIAGRGAATIPTARPVRTRPRKAMSFRRPQPPLFIRTPALRPSLPRPTRAPVAVGVTDTARPRVICPSNQTKAVPLSYSNNERTQGRCRRRSQRCLECSQERGLELLEPGRLNLQLPLVQDRNGCKRHTPYPLHAPLLAKINKEKQSHSYSFLPFRDTALQAPYGAVTERSPARRLLPFPGRSVSPAAGVCARPLPRSPRKEVPAHGHVTCPFGDPPHDTCTDRSSHRFGFLSRPCFRVCKSHIHFLGCH
uniref:Uncharacterized protein LOC110193647 n=1 Tax=Phascolarctos cinereus TaxID=38626 RepID=A0A6P5IQJ1_PHACI|nr:uncharacterized protein LOC110193647 [Phascolarctos cinereus]